MSSKMKILFWFTFLLYFAKGDTDNKIALAAEDVNVKYLEPEFFNTKIGATHRVSTPVYALVDTESCNVLTPNGMEYNLDTDIEGIEFFSDERVACGMRVTVKNENMVGDWVLIARQLRYGTDKVERRLPFTIHVEEIVEADLEEIKLEAGMTFYIKLRNPIADYATCVLLGPDGKKYESYEADFRYTDSCGFIVRNVQATHKGQWEIVYGKRITYRAPFEVRMTTGSEVTDSLLDLVLTLGRPVNLNVGPTNAVYCKVEDSQGYTISAAFGRCNITLDRVTMEHKGTWKMYVALPGRMITVDSTVTVRVVEADPKPVVKVNILLDKPSVTLSCSISSPDPIRACKFRDPSGRVLLATEGVGESRYSFHGAGVSYTSGVHTHDCGIRIADPIAADLGIWRCAIETEGETYYGFLKALCPWALRDPEVAAEILTEPTLTADRSLVSAVVGDGVSMSCSVQSAIRYCYFRASNGTVFNVGPGQSHDTATYVGAGFDAGECGIRFPTLSVADTGAWSCHVGFSGENMPEQRADIGVSVYDLMVTIQRLVGGQLLVESQVHDQATLEYCRYVRIDGNGFIGENLPKGYTSIEDLSTGKCGLVVEEPTMLDHHPWTVVARIRGLHEVSRVTAPTLMPEGPNGGTTVYFRVPSAWIVIMLVGLTLMLTAAMIGPKKNRTWTYERAGVIRESFRRGFVRKTVESAQPEQKNTAMAA